MIDSTVIIRSHGVSKDVYDSLHEKNVNIVDATCPFVLKIHKIVKEESANGSQIVIIGNENHPEVEGIMGWSLSDTYVIDTSEKAQNLVLDSQRRVCIVSQTTFNYNKFQELVEIISKKGYNIIIRNTICNATEERQTEAREIAKRVDAMIVIGGSSSSNTRKLYEICKKECYDTFYIQTINDLDLESLGRAECIGITAGASTQTILSRRFALMSESFAEMLEESIKQIHTGEIVDGTVIDVKEDQIILNIGYKADGIITRNEYSSDPNVDLRDVVKVGDEMQAKVRKVNDGEGQVILSRKGLVAEQGSKKLEEAFENQTVITATVSQVMNGGLGVVVDEARVFIPASLVSDTFVKDLSVYKDKEVSFVITEYNPKKRRIIGDCKKFNRRS